MRSSLDREGGRINDQLESMVRHSLEGREWERESM